MTTHCSPAPRTSSRPAAKPRALVVNPAKIPTVLKAKNQWVCWRYVYRGGKWTKVPMNPRTGREAKPNDPSTWGSFEDAIAALFRHPTWDGIGFVLTKDDPFAGCDLDSCIGEDGVMVASAAAIVAEFGTYTELSPSSEGVRMFLIGRKAAFARCTSNKIEGFKQIEIYDDLRYLTITGAHVEGTPLTVECRQEQLDALCRRLWPPEEANSKSNGHPTASGVVPDLGDAELIDEAKTALNGDKFSRLWAGETADHAGDDSRADLALCGMLAFWTGPDAARIDRLFRQSGLHRPKWDSKRGSSTYGQNTIRKALSGKTEFYSPQQPRRRQASMTSVSTTPAVTALEGPSGIRLMPIKVTATPQRRSARFTVAVNGKRCDAELAVTDTAAGLNRAVADLREICGDQAPEAKELRRWLRQLLTTSSLDRMAGELQERRASEEPTASPCSSMLKITREFMAERFDLRFVLDDGSVWSERHGKIVSRNDFMNHVDPKLLEALKAASDYPAPTPNDPTKPIRHLQFVLKPCWTELTVNLPREVHAESLGPESKAAARFRGQIERLWMTPETWIKVESREGQSHVERMSLASRARTFFESGVGVGGGWRHVLRGVNAFYRIEKARSGDSVIWLGMRADVCRNSIKGAAVDGVQSQEDLSRLMRRYGLSDDGHVTDRVREDDMRCRICVLSRALCDYLIQGADTERPDPAGPQEGGPPGPALSDRRAMNGTTGHPPARV